MRIYISYLLVAFITLLIEVLISFNLDSLPFLLPNTTVIFVVFLAFFEITPAGAVLVFLAGLLRDMTTTTVLGPWAGTVTLIYMLVVLFANRVFMQSALSIGFTVFASSCLADVIYFLLRKGVQPTEFRPVWHLLLSAIIAAGAAPIIFSQLRRIFRKHFRRRALS